MATYTRTDKFLVTVTVASNGETEVDMGGAVMSFYGDAVMRAEQFALIMKSNNARLVEIVDDSTMLVEFVHEIDLHEEAIQYDNLRRWSGL